jgi:hypothetical protein
MKKILIVAALVSVLSLIGIGVALAQDETPETPEFPYRFGGHAGEGWMHEYMYTEMADALGISPEDYESRIAAGQTLYDIAEDLGIDLDTLGELHLQARSKAMKMAFEAGAISEEQYQYFQERMELNEGFGPSGMMGFGGGHGRHGGGQMFEEGFSGGRHLNGDCPGYYNNQVPQN